MAAGDVAAAIGEIAVGAPTDGTVEIGGPETLRLDEAARQSLATRGDSREVITDPHGRYYDIAVKEYTLLPGDGARLGTTLFEDWLAQGNWR